MKFHAFYILTASVLTVKTSPVLHDRRQTGETNVQIDLKDVVLIAIADESLSGDYDYSYDYSDLTVKPDRHSTTSPSPPSSTVEEASNGGGAASATTQNSSYLLEKENNTLTITSNEPQEPQHPLNSENFQIPVMVIHETDEPGVVTEKKYLSSNDLRRKATHDLPKRNCAQGFFLDDRNRCKKINKPNILQRDRSQLPSGLRFPQRPSDAVDA